MSTIEELFPRDNRRSEPDRNRSIHKVHFEFRYPMTDIVRHLGLYYSTVTRVMNINELIQDLIPVLFQ